MIAWVIIVLCVASFLTLYLGFRLIEPTRLGRGTKIMMWLLVIALLFGQRFTWLVDRQGVVGDLMIAIDWIGFVFLGVISLLVMVMLLRDIPILFQRMSSGWKTLTVKRSKRPYFIEPNRERRRFLLNVTNGTMVAAVLPLTGYGVYRARAVPKIVYNELPVIDLAPELDGFTIAHISDTHIGPTLRKSWARMVTDEVNKLDADMIVHTGDMVDGSVAALNGSVQPFADLSAPHGVWFCVGNHEYYSGVEPWLAEAKRLGMRPLVNEHVVVDTGRGKILMGGVSDYGGSRLYPAHVSSPEKAMFGASDHDVSILLAHQPRSVYQASKAGFDIQLSGHTHGGQYFPWTLAIHLFQPYVRGLHVHDATLLYVNEGTGYWGPPLRLGAGPEITLHTLKSV